VRSPVDSSAQKLCEALVRCRNRRGTSSEKSNWNENWQFPQGGIDEGEDPLPAAFRELAEETSITEVEFVAETAGWLTYDFDTATKAALGARMDKYRGQKQKYFLMKFTGAVFRYRCYLILLVLSIRLQCSR
jgi:8-oxo-dGTP pyrophosphatase MutT (NUDIX family)